MWARLSYTILFSGQAGAGKRDFTMHSTQGLPCDTPTPDGQSYGTCATHNRLARGNHPDPYLACPEAVRDVSETEKDASGKKKAPNEITRMEQVRNLIEGVGVGTYRTGLRVVVLHPLDVLQTESANVLLKTLEEPSQNIVFLLAADRVGRILPIIPPCCRQFPLQQSQSEVAR